MELLRIETALECVLHPYASSDLGDRLARQYAERYSSRYGTGLISKSAPFVEDIAEFWGKHFLGRGWRKRLANYAVPLPLSRRLIGQPYFWTVPEGQRTRPSWPSIDTQGHSMSNNSLYQPFTLHDLKLANRIALAPMTRSRAGVERILNRLMAEYYAQRSSAGLLITEATTISEEANCRRPTTGLTSMAAVWKTAPAF
jgi:hypothetical protein